MKAHWTCLRRFFALLPLGMLCFSWSLAQSRDQFTVRLTDRVILQVPPAWRIIPKTGRGLDELYLPAGPMQPESMRVRVSITQEARTDHGDALRRLKQIETGIGGQTAYVNICGWPALQRVATVPTPERMIDRVGPEVHQLSPTMTQVTVAVAAGSTIIRLDSGLAMPAVPADIQSVEALANALVCSEVPAKGQTQIELQSMQLQNSRPLTEFRAPLVLAPPKPQLVPERELPRPEIREKPIFTPPPPARAPYSVDSPPHLSVPNPSRLAANPLPEDAAGDANMGELQIAVGNDAQHEVVAANFEQWTSSDGGASFQNGITVNLPTGYSRSGDPTVGVGVSGNFYFSMINPGSQITGQPLTPCTLPVSSSSTDFGHTFNFVNDAKVCQAGGLGTCFPDQEQMAVDRLNSGAAPGAPIQDQLYMVWRNLVPTGTPTQCWDGFGAGATGETITATIACSNDSGKTWIIGGPVGPATGDWGRPAVAPNGDVYVTFISDGSLMIRRFSSCATGLKPGPLVQVASFLGGLCPIAGLDRCQDPDESSPQPAVDDQDSSHVLVAWAQGTGTASGPEDMLVSESHDYGMTWTPQLVNAPNPVAQRFLPWICTTGGYAYVTWYDRRFATATRSDITNYFLNTVNLANTSGTGQLGTEVDLSSPYGDPQCASGWAGGADSMNDGKACPPSPNGLTGVCRTSSGTGSQTVCSANTQICTVPDETCVQPQGGTPKYGDYNGNACLAGSAFVAWASDTNPATGQTLGLNNMAVYTSRVSATCGGGGQSCCSSAGLAACNQPNLACVQNSCIQCTISGGPGTPQTVCPPGTVLPTGPTLPPSTAQLALMECEAMCLNPNWLATYYPGVADASQQCSQDCTTGKVPFKLDCSEQFGKALNTCQQQCGSTLSIYSGAASALCKNCLRSAGAAVPTTCTAPPISH